MVRVGKNHGPIWMGVAVDQGEGKGPNALQGGRKVAALFPGQVGHSLRSWV